MSRKRAVGRPQRQSPYRRRYQDGRTVWVARYRNLEGEVRYAKPRSNGGKATFARMGDAQRAIDEALEQLHGRGDVDNEKLGAYFEDWLERHPRSPRTNKTNRDRIGYVLDVQIDGRELREWRFDELRRRHAHLLLDHLLRVQGRAASGARGILSSLSTMTEDAIVDDAATDNPFIRVRLRANDPRVQKPPRRPRIWTFEQMREFAAGGRPGVRAKTRRPPDPRNRRRYSEKERFFAPHDYEALILTPGYTGLRLGEFLALSKVDFNGSSLSFRFSAHEGELVGSSEQKNHERTVPVPPTLARLIARRDPDPSAWLFPSPSGKIWRESNFYRDVWLPAQIATGLDPTPHEFRHSYVTQLRAEGVDDADLAKVAGHRVETMISVYTHPLGRSHDQIRDLIG